MTRGPLQAGEPVLLVDHRGRRYMVHLKPGQKFHFHNGVVEHDALIGMEPATTFYSSLGGRLRVFRPTLADYVLKMPRAATVVYPKDLGAILVRADIFPGASVLEAGLGSGALAITLLRAVGSEGRVVSYELRDDHAARGASNVEAFFRAMPPQLEIRMGDVGAVAEEAAFDRVVLDLPEPWSVAPGVARALVPGGLWCSYVPTVPQIQQTVTALEEHGFARIETSETLVRTWNISGPSVRPDHRMVAHTGFLTTAVLLHGPPK